MNFPKIVLLYEGAVELGNVPDQRACGIGAYSEEILPLTSWHIFCLPKPSPRSVWFGNPIPPYLSSHCVIVVEGIPQS